MTAAVFVDFPVGCDQTATMARVQKPPPGRLIISVIYSSMDALADALNVLERKFGRVQFETPEIPCAETSLYGEEMGGELLRRFFSFDKMVARDGLPSIKGLCHKIEPQFADRVDDYLFRTVNLDPGILTPANLVMASHREYNHRVYLNNGVFAELALVYSRGRFVRLPWTCPDFYGAEAIEFFGRVRASLEVVQEDEVVLQASAHSWQ